MRVVVTIARKDENASRKHTPYIHWSERSILVYRIHRLINKIDKRSCQYKGLISLHSDFIKK
jgi:hypothetical protein